MPRREGKVSVLKFKVRYGEKRQIQRFESVEAAMELEVDENIDQLDYEAAFLVVRIRVINELDRALKERIKI